MNFSEELSFMFKPQMINIKIAFRYLKCTKDIKENRDKEQGTSKMPANIITMLLKFHLCNVL
jgi:hypothetical protein